MGPFCFYSTSHVEVDDGRRRAAKVAESNPGTRVRAAGVVDAAAVVRDVEAKPKGVPAALSSERAATSGDAGVAHRKILDGQPR